MRSFFFITALAVSSVLFSCKNDPAASAAATPSSQTSDEAPPANTPTAMNTDGEPSTAASNPNETTIATGPTTTIKLSAGSFDFGTVKEGTVVQTSVSVTNTGKEPLVITNCHASCGCTTPTCPHDPVAPGQTVEVPIKFDSKGKPGHQRKEVTITANTIPAQTKFVVEGQVDKVK